MKQKMTAAERRAVEQYGRAACLKAVWLNEVQGEGPCMIACTVGSALSRVGKNLINAGRKLAKIEEDQEMAAMHSRLALQKAAACA